MLNADGSFLVFSDEDDRIADGTFSFNGDTLVFQYDTPDAKDDSMPILLLSPWTLVFADPPFPDDLIYLSRIENPELP